MKIKKVIVFLFALMLVVTTPNIVGGQNHEMKKEKIIDTGISDNYNDCYVEIRSLLSDEDYPKLFNLGSFWKIMFLRLEGNEKPSSFVLYWYMRLDENAQITIKSEKNGDILWEHDGSCEQEIRMIRFNGGYISTLTDEGRAHKDISGHVQKIWLKDLI